MLKWLILLSLVAGCERAALVPAQVKSYPNYSAEDINVWDSHSRVQLVMLENGIECAVIVGQYKGAIDCNWERRR